MRPFTALMFAGALAVSALTVAPIRAAEIPEDVDAKTLKKAQERFEREFDTADIDYKLKAIRTYSKHQHKSIAKHLLKLMRKAEKHERAALARGLGTQLSSAKSAGAKLVKIAEEQEEEEHKVVTACVDSIGDLEYRKADKTLKKLIHHLEDDVVAAVFTCYGKWKSDEAMIEMLSFFNKYPDEKSFATGTVTVDTGAAGSEDANAAKAKWKSKYGGQRNWRPRPICTKALIAALKEITGFGFRRPEDLKRYMDAPEKYVDPETIADRIDEPTRMKIYAKWWQIKDRAAALAKDEIPGETENPERAKVYRKHLYGYRGQILKKHKMELSELDVIVEDGDKRGWPKK